MNVLLRTARGRRPTEPPRPLPGVPPRPERGGPAPVLPGAVRAVAG
ncbi:hypothetical protein ACIBBD_19410 [Streptomyces sp. NPDC051315]